MNRKRITFWLFLFLSLPTLASAQQVTKADIQSLEAKITNLETTVREMDKRLAAQIQAVQTTMTEMDKRLTAQMQSMDKRLTTQMQSMDKRITTQMQSMDKRITTQINVLFWAIGALIALILAVIALPQLLGYFQERRARTDFQKEIDELKQRPNNNSKRLRFSKSQRIVTPS
ncbi:MAG: hypothetical protein ACE5PV_01475 [Candidatus Poribacteria bacterium]